MSYKMTPALREVLVDSLDAEEWADSYKQEMREEVARYADGDAVVGPTIREVIDREESELQATYPVYGMIEYFGLENTAREMTTNWNDHH